MLIFPFLYFLEFNITCFVIAIVFVIRRFLCEILYKHLGSRYYNYDNKRIVH